MPRIDQISRVDYFELGLLEFGLRANIHAGRYRLDGLPFTHSCAVSVACIVVNPGKVGLRHGCFGSDTRDDLIFCWLGRLVVWEEGGEGLACFG